GMGFAGHTDWRIPSFFELQSLMKLDLPPQIDAAFNTGCVATCTSCSCTQSSGAIEYWSSSTQKGQPRFAYSVDFGLGNSSSTVKVEPFAARAVRGGR